MYQGYYAMIRRPLRNSAGQNTSAPFHVARFLMNLIRDHSPAYLGAVFDAGTSFREEIFSEYKATREQMPDDLYESLDLCRSVFDVFGVPVIEVDGWEADDVIGTLAGQASRAEIHTVIVSGDKDFLQLVSEDTTLLNPGRGGPGGVDAVLVTAENAEKRLGVPPSLVTDYLALLGDSADNVPGVPGIGRKTAPPLLREFGGLEGIIERASEVTPARVCKAITQNADQARLSKQLVTIKTDAPVSLDLPALKAAPLDRPRALRVFRELDAQALIKELELAHAHVDRPGLPDLPVKIVEGPAAVEDAVKALRARLTAPSGSARDPGQGPVGGPESDLPPMLAMVLVTDPPPKQKSGNRRAPERWAPAEWDPVGVALSAPGAAPWYFPLRGDGGGSGSLFADERLLSLAVPEMAPLGDLLASPVPKLGYDLKHALQVLQSRGIELGGVEPGFDAALTSYCLEPDLRDRSLSRLAANELKADIPSRDDLAGVGPRRMARDLPVGDVATWAGRHAVALHAVAASQTRKLDERPGTGELLSDLEMPLVGVLARMERRGVAIDRAFFATLSVRMQHELAGLEAAVRQFAGDHGWPGKDDEQFNPRSVPHLRWLLFEHLGLPVVKRTKTGPSTDEAVLAQLAGKGHEVARIVLEHRELTKLDRTYVRVLPRIADENGRVHTQFNQFVAGTGRLSSSMPNLQNIPIRSALGREIRKGFVSAPGTVLLAADYSQIELRILAHLSGDEAFVEAFRAGRDIHRETAARIFEVPPAEVTGDMRGTAKTINFATIYGQGPVALGRQLGWSTKKAREFIDRYFERFAGVAGYLESMKQLAQEQGFVETIWGRRRYIPGIRSVNRGVQSHAERTAANSPIQGSAADIIKKAMIDLDARLRGTRSAMLLQVHDELLFEVAEDEAADVGDLVKQSMEGAARLAVPLEVDGGAGRTWYDCKFKGTRAG